MASQITPETIDAQYPVAGKDNDTQGFRDNFQIIKTALETAKIEINDIQDNRARLDIENNFQGTLLTNGTLNSSTESFVAVGGVLSSQELSFTNGMYQSVRFAEEAAGATVQFTLSNFPSTGDRVAKFRVQFFGVDGEPVTVSFAALGGATIYKSPNFPATLLIDSPSEPIIIDFWSYDGGNSYVFAEYIGRFAP
jgi:hypothetical protein